VDPTYWLDLFTGTTWKEFLAHEGRVSGFREGRWGIVKRIKPGDVLLCYLTGVQRWVGALKVVTAPYRDTAPIWKSEAFPCRLKVEPVIILTPELGVPMSEVMRHFEAPAKWGGLVRGSPNRLAEVDGRVIVKALEAAKASPVKRPVDQRKLARVPKTYQTKIGPVTIPVEDKPPLEAIQPTAEGVVTHEEIQWLLLTLGSDMGLDVWVARNDRNRQYSGNVMGTIARTRKQLPQQFDEATNRTIELIDVLWLQGHSIAPAFEIEHTTAIYSGLLRMADLISMQPNIKIRLFIVAPDEKREKVIEEINRPTFSRLSPPLNTVCRFIAYSALKTKLAQVGEFVRHLKPDFVMDISESCETTT
jgi:hypothetical protein